MSRNNMYTGHQKNFSVYNAEEKNVWEDVIENLSAKYDDFAIYMPMQDPEIVVRGVCVKGSVEEPPMIEGNILILIRHGLRCQRLFWEKTARRILLSGMAKSIIPMGG